MQLDTLTASTARTSSSSLTDEELVVLARAGDDWALETLLVRYRSYARAKAHSFFLIGADREDIVQEGMIGLFKAVRDFREERRSSFRAFAELCITRQVKTAIRAATRQKHIPLNTYISLNKPFDLHEEGEASLADTLDSNEISDPLEILLNFNDFAALRNCFEEILSGLEAEVLLLYLDGKSYQEIAEVLGRHVKSIDNALQRIKRKIELHIVDRETVVVA